MKKKPQRSKVAGNHHYPDPDSEYLISDSDYPVPDNSRPKQEINLEDFHNRKVVFPDPETREKD